MYEDKLNKFIKSKVHDYETNMDIDSFWQDIETKQTKKEEPKRRIFWWFFFGGLCLVISSILYVFWGDELVKMEEVSPTGYAKSGQSITATEVTINEKITDVDNTLSNQEKLDLINEKDAATKVRKSETQASLTTKYAIDPSKNEKGFNAGSTLGSRSNRLNTNSSQTNHQLGEKNIKQAIDLNPIEGSLGFNVKDQLQSPTQQDSLLTNEVQEKIEISNANLSSHLIVATLPQKWSFLEVDELKLIPQGQKLLDDFWGEPSKTTSKKMAKWSIAAHFGYGFSNRKLNGISEYANTRNQLETPEQVLGAGLDLQHQFASGWYLKSGLNYEQITERFDLDRTTESEQFFNATAANVIYRMSDGTINTELGTTSIRRQIQFRKVFNRYRSIDLPLTVGYSSMFDKKWNFFAEGGLLINLAFLPEGQILDADNETFLLLEESEVFKSTTGMSLNMGIGASYELNDRLSFWISPRFRFGLASMTIDSYELEQSFGRIALRVGLRTNL